MNRIQKTQEFLKQTFEASDYARSHPIECSYRYEHTLRVAHWGEQIAISENLNVEALVVGCLLHDISYSEQMETKEDWVNHGRRAAEMSRDFIKSLNFEVDVANEILYGIAAHVDDKPGFDGQPSTLSKSIGDADNLDRFDVYRIYESLEYDQFSKMNLNDKLNYCENRVNRAEQNLSTSFTTEFATRVFHEELLYMKDFFQNLYGQLSLSLPF